MYINSYEMRDQISGLTNDYRWLYIELTADES